MMILEFEGMGIEEGYSAGIMVWSAKGVRGDDGGRRRDVARLISRQMKAVSVWRVWQYGIYTVDRSGDV